ncbi:leucine zipper domain-containing protein [Streptomyces sp. NBC_01231]|nr:leucine zipper domain-containing protein [Streptomyces sp. NBC_01231]
MSGNVAATCRCYGISRQCSYTRRRRYEAEGLDGLKDRSSAPPRRTPRATTADVVEKILWLRRQYQFGPAKTAMYLQRYHDVVDQHVRRLADSEEGRPQPAAGITALQAPIHPLETLREAAPGPPTAGRRQIHRAGRPERPQEALPPLHRHRRLHPPEGAARLRPQWWSSVRPSTGTCSTRARGRSHQASDPRLNGKVERSHPIDSEEFYHLL